LSVSSLLLRFLPCFGHGDTLVGFLGHPYFIARFNLSTHLKKYIQPHANQAILDVGCGTMPYKKYFHGCILYDGLEIDQPRSHSNSCATYFYDGINFPMENNSYDAVICSQVLEHSFAPETLISEVVRVLKPGGTFYLSIPFMWPEHEQPYDSQRYTSFGLSAILHKNGLQISSISKSSHGLIALMQLGIEWLESQVRRRRLGHRTFFFWRILTAIPYSVANMIALSLMAFHHDDANSAELFLDLIVVSQKS